MYEVGKVVLHKINGVCRIEDIREENLTGESQMYYVMHPIFEKSSSILYLPIEDRGGLLRALYTPSEIDHVILKGEDEKIEWIDNNNLRKTTYTELWRKGTTSQLVALIRCLTARKTELEEQGKKFSVTDERILSEARNRVDQEFAYSLNIDRENVPNYVLDIIAKREK